MGGSDVEGEGKQVLVGICAMAKKSQSKPMKEILTRLEEFEYIKIIVFPEEVILKVIYIYFYCREESLCYICIQNIYILHI